MKRCLLLVLVAACCACGTKGVFTVPDARGDGSSGTTGMPDGLDSGRGTVGDAPDVAAQEVEPLADAPADISAGDPGWVPDVTADQPGLPDVVDLVDTAEPDVLFEITPQDLPPAYMFPNQWGPYEVGTRSYQWFDMERMRLVPTTIWYPGIPGNQPKAKYLVLIQGKAYTNALADKTGAPYPLVMFSHGFRGVAVQSISFTEFIASHGYVVVAMDHTGNTLTDFFSDDEKVAEVALERPSDVLYSYKQACAESMKNGSPLNGMIDPSRVAMSGHSFGGWTTLMIGGGEVEVSVAQAACAAGAPSDIFCDYVGYWPSDMVVKVDPGIPGLKALVALAPGGYSSFGDPGLAKVKVPAMIFGGTLDPTTPVAVEIDPIYNALPPPKYEVVLKDVSHMSFTNVCDLPAAELALADYCGVEGMLPADEAFAMTNGLAVTFLDYYVKKIDVAHQFLTPEFVAAFYPSAIYSSQE